MVESETHEEVAERAAEGAMASNQSAWWRPAISHSAAVVAGAAVAVAVVATTIGLSPRVRVLRVPVVRTVTVRVPAKPRVSATPQPTPSSPQKEPAPAKPADEPPRISLPRIPLILPPAPTTVRTTVKTAPPARPHVRAGASNAATSKPSTPRSPLIEGLLAADRGDVDLAIQLFKKASDAAPRDPVPYLKLKEMYERKMVTAEKLEDEERYRALAAAARDNALAILQPAPVAAGQ